MTTSGSFSGSVPVPPELLDMHDSGGDPRDLTWPQRKALRQLFEDRDTGLYLFNYFIMGYTDITPEVHMPLSQFVGRWGETHLSDGKIITHSPSETEEPLVADSWRRLMVCIPREMFKTSFCTRGGSLWLLAKDPTHDFTIGIFNEKQDNAERWVGAIAEVVEGSRLFQVLWEEMLPPGVSFWDKDAGKSMPRRWKWGANGIKFVRNTMGIAELSIEGFGIGGAATGKHFTHKILDDIIGEKAANSQAIMQDAVDWVDNARPLERPAEGGCELVVHTPWAYADVYTHMLRKWPGEYKVYKRHLLEDTDGNPDAVNGTSIMPSKYSTPKAKKLLQTDPFVNSAQYQCVPKAGREMSFDSEWLRYGRIVFSGQEPVFRIADEHYDPEIFDLDCDWEDIPPQLVPLSWMSKAIIIDPIPGKPAELKQEPNCKHGIVAVGKDPWGRRYCFESLLERCPPEDLFHTCMRLADKWGSRTIAIEEVNFSYVFQPYFHLLGRDYEWQPDIIPTTPGGLQKNDRILKRLQGPHQSGFWYYNKDGTAVVVAELTEFPHSATKDAIDAQSYTDDVCDRPETPEEAQRSYFRGRRASGDRGITGYGRFS